MCLEELPRSLASLILSFGSPAQYAWCCLVSTVWYRLCLLPSSSPTRVDLSRWLPRDASPVSLWSRMHPQRLELAWCPPEWYKGLCTSPTLSVSLRSLTLQVSDLPFEFARLASLDALQSLTVSVANFRHRLGGRTIASMTTTDHRLPVFPHLTQLCLRDIPVSIMMDLSNMEEMRVLTLVNACEPASVDAALACPTLTSLDFDDGEVTSSHRMSRHDYTRLLHGLPHLTSLACNIDFDRKDDKQQLLLSVSRSSSHVTSLGLRTLKIYGHYEPHDEPHPLRSSYLMQWMYPTFKGIGFGKNLTTLHIGKTHANDDTLVLIGDSCFASHLRRLVLNHCQLADFRPLSKLTSLHTLSASRCGHEYPSRPAFFPALPSVQTCSLPNGLSSVTIIPELGSLLPNVRSLDLGQNHISLDFSLGLSFLSGMPKIRFLNVSDVWNFDMGHARWLCKNKPPELQQIELRYRGLITMEQFESFVQRRKERPDHISCDPAMD